MKIRGGAFVRLPYFFWCTYFIPMKILKLRTILASVTKSKNLYVCRRQAGLTTSLLSCKSLALDSHPQLFDPDLHREKADEAVVNKKEKSKRMGSRRGAYKLLLCVVVLGCLPGCVSKKKLLASQSLAQARQDSLSQQLVMQQVNNDSLRLALAYQQGANEALLLTQDKLQDRLDDLQLEIDQLSSSASSTVQDLRNQLREKDRTIAARQARLDAVQAVLDRRRERLVQLEKALRSLSDSLASEACSFRQGGGGLIMAIQEDALFRKGSTSRLEAAGTELLNAVAELSLRYPEMQVTVVGHTDNRPVDRQSLDNWQYSALRAVSVVKYLTEATDLGANRLLAAGKGQFEPLESNETSEGRARNRRVELVFAPDNALFMRNLVRALE
ncbi:MAG: hypothetical protein D6772_02405 [Bacteroidetes bacterium]|nr:MAG: hypothetical protein D6772_02405 [Bacteroidota bacterium]